MPNSSEQFSLVLNWAYFEVPPGGTNTFYLPVGSLSIMAKPYSNGSIGATSFSDVNGTRHYRCEGFRHDVKLTYSELPTTAHATFADLVQKLHDTGGEVRFQPAESQGTKDASTGTIDLVADLSGTVLQAAFDRRERKRSESLTLKGKNIVSTIKPWLTD